MKRQFFVVRKKLSLKQPFRENFTESYSIGLRSPPTFDHPLPSLGQYLIRAILTTRPSQTSSPYVCNFAENEFLFNPSDGISPTSGRTLSDIQRLQWLLQGTISHAYCHGK